MPAALCVCQLGALWCWTCLSSGWVPAWIYRNKDLLTLVSHVSYFLLPLFLVQPQPLFFYRSFFLLYYAINPQWTWCTNVQKCQFPVVNCISFTAKVTKLKIKQVESTQKCINPFLLVFFFIFNFIRVTYAALSQVAPKKRS